MTDEAEPIASQAPRFDDDDSGAGNKQKTTSIRQMFSREEAEHVENTGKAEKGGLLFGALWR